MNSSIRPVRLPCSSFAVPLLLLVLVGCSTTPEQQALEDIRDTTIIPNLGSYDDQIQQEAVARMLSILESAPEVGRNLLVASLRDPVHDDRTKMVCAWLLSTVNDRRALPTLMEFLGRGTDSDESLLREAVVSFGASVVPSVARVLDEGSDVARIAAAEVLCELETSEAVDALIARYAAEPHPRVRFLILCGVADESPPRVAPLERALSDEEAVNREFAWTTLARLFRLPPSITFDPDGNAATRRAQIDRFRAWREGRS